VLNVDTYETSAAFLSPSAVVSYLEDIVRTVETIQSDFQGGGGTILSDRITDGIHALAGKAGMFGFARLTSISRQVEHAARIGQIIERERSAEFDDALRATLAEARDRLEAARATCRAISDEARVEVT
jgi:HPt (histidine-containing phosphotransfer) domain-containing protein